MFTFTTDYTYDANPRRLEQVRLAECFMKFAQECRYNNASILPLFERIFANKLYELNLPSPCNY